MLILWTITLEDLGKVKTEPKKTQWFWIKPRRLIMNYGSSLFCSVWVEKKYRGLKEDFRSSKTVVKKSVYIRLFEKRGMPALKPNEVAQCKNFFGNVPKNALTKQTEAQKNMLLRDCKVYSRYLQAKKSSGSKQMLVFIEEYWSVYAIIKSLTFTDSI